MIKPKKLGKLVLARIQYVCFDCGKLYGETGKDNVVTYHQGICEICGHEKGLTHKRNFNYLRKYEANR